VHQEVIAKSKENIRHICNGKYDFLELKSVEIYKYFSLIWTPFHETELKEFDQMPRSQK
jgi:hypothetical protein